MINEEPKNSEILEAINSFASSVDERFEKIDQRFDHVENEISGMKSEIVGMKSEISGVKSEIVGIKNQMVTKDFLTDKLGQLRGDLVALVRKEDQRVNGLIRIMEEDNVISKKVAQKMLATEVLPQTA
ncbi:MAG: hypothetical protein V1821_02830 [bacterium]